MARLPWLLSPSEKISMAADLGKFRVIFFFYPETDGILSVVIRLASMRRF